MRLIDLRAATYTYPNGHQAVDGIDLAIGPGEAVAIIGHNGAGKTTVAKLMNGLFRPTGGDVIVDGRSTKEQTTGQISRIIGYVSHNPDDQIFHNDVGSEIAFGPRMLGIRGPELRARIDEAARIAGIADLLNDNPYNLPSSRRKFVAIASTLAMGGRAFVLDEPTAGQDKAGMEVISAIVGRLISRGVTVVTISHDIQFVADTFERVVVMAGKKIIADGSKREVLWNRPILDQAGLRQTLITDLARRLSLGPGPLTVADMVQALRPAGQPAAGRPDRGQPSS
jgi:energy-coupling factor transport system ATP-binding protein